MLCWEPLRVLEDSDCTLHQVSGGPQLREFCLEGVWIQSLEPAFLIQQTAEMSDWSFSLNLCNLEAVQLSSS